jgi:hypothetical protein
MRMRMLQLRTFASEVTRVALEVGTHGVLGGQARVEGVEGAWSALTFNVNVRDSFPCSSKSVLRKCGSLSYIGDCWTGLASSGPDATRFTFSEEERCAFVH